MQEAKPAMLCCRVVIVLNLKLMGMGAPLNNMSNTDAAAVRPAGQQPQQQQYQGQYQQQQGGASGVMQPAGYGQNGMQNGMPKPEPVGE